VSPFLNGRKRAAEVAAGGETGGEFRVTLVGFIPCRAARRPPERQQDGGAQNAGPEAGLGGHIADVLTADKVIGDAPNEWPKGKKSQHEGRQDEERVRRRPAF